MSDPAAVPDVSVPPDAADRWLAAAAHFGIPLWSCALPLTIWAVSAGRPFRRAHARQAFTFQCGFLVLWVGAVASMLFGVLAPLALVALLALGLLSELPQAARALTGKAPLPVPPGAFLPE